MSTLALPLHDELFEVVVFACAWCVEDVAYGSGAVRASTEVGAAAGVDSVAVLARFLRSRQKVSFFRPSAAATRPYNQP